MKRAIEDTEASADENQEEADDGAQGDDTDGDSC